MDYSTDESDFKFFYVTQNTIKIGVWRNEKKRKK